MNLTKEREHNRIVQSQRMGPDRLKRIHVNQPKIAGNHRNKTYEPVLTVKGRNQNLYGHEVRLIKDGEVLGVFTYREDDPLSCGARVWFETTLEVEVVEFENVYPEERVDDEKSS